MKEKIHPIIAGLLLLLFLMTPEMYAYTFMILYDYSNMIFFFLSLYFLFDYFRNKIPAHFYFAGLLMGIATYIRSETLVLAFLFLPPILLTQIRGREPVKKIALANLFFFLPSLLGYYLTSQLYIKYYLPVHYDIGSLINNHLSDLHPLFQRYTDIVTHLVASEFGIHLWGYLFYITAFLFLAEGLFRGRYNKDARNWLYAILALYIGIGALGFALPMMNLNETTKRALFKLLPLAVLYLANNNLLFRLSQWISRWEGAPLAFTLIGKRPIASASARPAADRPAPGKSATQGKSAAPAGKSRSSKKRRNK
jgi:hypothetical protein